MLLNPNKDALSICKRLHSTISNRNKELQHLSKELSLSENFLNKIYNIAEQEIAAEIVIHSTKKVMFTDKGF